MPKLGLDRQILSGITKNHQAIVALERVFADVGSNLPDAIGDAALAAAQAIAAANSAFAELIKLSNSIEYLQVAPTPQVARDEDDTAQPLAFFPVERDDLAPVPPGGSMAWQNADRVEITGGTISGTSQNDATTVAISDDTTTNATMYPLWSTATGGQYAPKTSSTKWTFNPSTGLMTVPSVSAQFNGTLGITTPAAAVVTTLSASGQITSTIATGTAPFSIASTTVVPNLNVSQLLGGTWAIPGAIGSTTPNTGRFTTVGVGTATPTYRFVVSNSGAQGIELDSDGAAYGAGTTGILSYNRSGSAYVALNIDGLAVNMRASGTVRLTVDGTGIGFFGTTPAAKQTVTGSRGGNAALASLLTALSTAGLITDSTTA
jgi:hypothetical protein